MPKLELSDQESRLLAEVLAQCDEELRTEIVGTDDHEFRESLRRRAAAVGEPRKRLARA